MKVLVLDFDGVVADSVNEGLFTSYNSYLEFSPKTRIFGGRLLTFDNFSGIIKKYNSQYKKFRWLRVYLKTALDYYHILCAIESNAKIRNERDFEEFANKSGMSYEKYAKAFYGNRLIYMRDFNRWIKLTPIFPFVLKFMRKNNLSNVFISTSNRKSTIMKTFHHHNIGFVEENVLDNKVSLDKKEHMKIIKNNKKISYSDIVLIDDQLWNLLKIKPLKVKCFLAAWGYNNKEQRKEADRYGIRLVSKENLSQIIERFIYIN